MHSALHKIVDHATKVTLGMAHIRKRTYVCTWKTVDNHVPARRSSDNLTVINYILSCRLYEASLPDISVNNHNITRTIILSLHLFQLGLHGLSMRRRCNSYIYIVLHFVPTKLFMFCIILNSFIFNEFMGDGNEYFFCMPPTFCRL